MKIILTLLLTIMVFILGDGVGIISNYWHYPVCLLVVVFICSLLFLLKKTTNIRDTIKYILGIQFIAFMILIAILDIWCIINTAIYLCNRYF